MVTNVVPEHNRCARSKSENLSFFPSDLFEFVAREPMEANAAAVPPSVKKRLSRTDPDHDPDQDPERGRSLQSRFSAWTPLSDKRRNLQVKEISEHRRVHR